jgi:mono/diheme cytochrome c family protein
MMPKKVWFSLLFVGLAVAGQSAQQSQKQEQNKPAGATAGTQAVQVPHTFDITSVENARKNPIRFTDISVARGKKLFLSQCAACHGEKGVGNGSLAAEMKIAPPDFTKPDVLSKRTDGALFAIIGQGSLSMPGESKRLTARQRWDLVNFMRAVEGKTPATATSEERQKAKEAHTIVVPK